MGHSRKYLKARAWDMTVGMDNWDGEEGKIIRICFLSRSDTHACSVLYLTERSKSMGNKSDFDLGCIMHVKVWDSSSLVKALNIVGWGRKV